MHTHTHTHTQTRAHTTELIDEITHTYTHCHRYDCDVDLRELIMLSSVCDEYSLGPNGALVYCMEYLEENFDWLQEKLARLSGQTTSQSISHRSPLFVLTLYCLLSNA